MYGLNYNSIRNIINLYRKTGNTDKKNFKFSQKPKGKWYKLTKDLDNDYSVGEDSMVGENDDALSLDNNECDQLNFHKKNVEYEPCAIPIERGKPSLCLQVNIDPEVRSGKSETITTFDNRTKLFPFAPKHLVKNGQFVDHDLNEVFSADKNAATEHALPDCQIIKLKKNPYGDVFRQFNYHDRAKVVKGL